MLAPWKESYSKHRQCIKKQRHHFADKGPNSQSMVFPVVMYRHEIWTMKKAECWKIDTFELEKNLESHLRRLKWGDTWGDQTCKEIKPVNLIGNQLWIFIGRTDAEVLLLWPRDAKSQIIGKYLDAEKDWGQKKERAAEDEMVRQHHQLNGHEFDQTQGDSEGQGTLVCSSPSGHKELATT